MIRNIISLLQGVLKEIEKDNPYNLIGKGGTILSVYHLNHRDSQDLDFDCLNANKDKDWDTYFKSIFDKAIQKFAPQKITYYVTKPGSFSSRGRYHMKVIFSTHKPLPPTKMEINFINSEPSDVLKHNQFRFYSLENLFFQKLKAFADRAEIKDVIDIGYSLKSTNPKLDPRKLRDYSDMRSLIEKAINRISELEKKQKEWKEEFQSTELNFKTVNERNFLSFIRKTKLELRKLSKIV